jgi:mono/diheme cytochrome c family protein
MARWLAAAILLLALSACDREGGRGRVVAAIPAEQAEALFMDKCAICHGEKGDGRGPRRASLFARPPDFRQPSWREGKSLSDVRTAIREGRPGSDMPAWKGLDEAEVAGLAEYVVGLGASASGGRTGRR